MVRTHTLNCPEPATQVEQKTLVCAQLTHTTLFRGLICQKDNNESTHCYRRSTQVGVQI